MLDAVLLFEVDCGHIKGVCSNHLVSEHSFVHDIDCDGFTFNDTLMEASWLKEEMLSPTGWGLTLASNAFLTCSILGDATSLYIYDWIDSVTIIKIRCQLAISLIKYLIDSLELIIQGGNRIF